MVNNFQGLVVLVFPYFSVHLLVQSQHNAVVDQEGEAHAKQWEQFHLLGLVIQQFGFQLAASGVIELPPDCAVSERNRKRFVQLTSSKLRNL